jgi:sulfatase modifying factor 1
MSWLARVGAGAPQLATSFVVLTACGRSGSRPAGPGSDAAQTVRPAPAPAGPLRPGMVFVPAGVLVAGTAVNDTPRVAEEELPAVRIHLDGFYIDLLPFPDEAGAIATTNVTRDDAAAMCTTKGKRLCTELEWERACKGPTNQTYEDGSEYHATACGLGTPADRAAKRPTGELGTCVSGFGVREMHGGAWEWTQGAWGRGGRKDLGVLKGGNAVAGEIAGRCANSLARAPSTKSPSMGFRCCAGSVNDAKVDLAVKVGPALERTMKTADLTQPWLSFARTTWSPKGPSGTPFEFVHAFTWRPVGNETLVVGSGCAHDQPHPRCGLIVGRLPGDLADASDGAAHVLATVDTGFEAAEVAEAGEAKHLRLKGVDAVSAFLRDFTYAYGLIELGDVRR